MERLDRVDDPRVQLVPALLQKAAVGDLMRERVLEGVLEIREQAGLVEQVGGLERFESATERVIWQLGDRLEQRERHVLAHDGSRLEQAFVLRGEPVDPRGENRLDRGRDLDRLDRLRQAIPSARAIQRLRLRQRSDRFFEKERIAALDQKLLERSESGIVAEERIQQVPGARGRERVEAHLAVGRLAAPAVLVLGTIVD